MAENTGISWCDATFNPWVGCTKVSPACDLCYAEKLMDHRYHRVEWGGPRSRTSAANWKQPLQWNRAAARDGVRRRVFCASLADVFDNQVSPDWRADLWALIAECDALDWLLLTKRPQNIGKMLPGSYVEQLVDRDLPPWPWPHVWLGTTTENQEEADRRIPILLATPAALHWLSVEPMLGPVDVAWSMSSNPIEIAAGFLRRGHFSPGMETLRPIAWVVGGGESQGSDRPTHPAWARSLRDQCAAAGVPFHWKQWGDHAPVPYEDFPGRLQSVREGDVFIAPDGRTETLGPDLGCSIEDVATPMRRVGAKAAGRLLDGVEHNSFPESRSPKPRPPGPEETPNV